MEKVRMLTDTVLDRLDGPVVVLDTETTGFNAYKDRIIEFAAVKLLRGREVEHMSELINPMMPIPQSASAVNHITNEMVAGKETEAYFAPKIFNFLKNVNYIVGHNVGFDIRFIEAMFRRNGLFLDGEYIDTLDQARLLYPDAPNHKLGTLAEFLRLRVEDAHRALSDVHTTVELLNRIIDDASAPKGFFSMSMMEESMCQGGYF